MASSNIKSSTYSNPKTTCITGNLKENYTLVHNGSREFVFFVQSTIDGRNISPTGSFPTGCKIEIYNVGNIPVVFNGTGMTKDILPGKEFSPAIFRFDGATWR